MTKPSLALRSKRGTRSAFRTAASFSDGFTGGDYFAAVQWEEEAGRVAEDRFQQLHLLGNLNLNLGRKRGAQPGHASGELGERRLPGSLGPVRCSAPARYGNRSTKR